MKRLAPTLLLALALAGCGAHGLAGTARAGAQPATLAEASRLDRAGYIKLSSQALAEAVAAGQQDVVAKFVEFADGEDPDPAATREIAKVGMANPELARIAAGGARARFKQATGIRFPQDEAAHLSAIMEWWYLNGHVEAASKQRYGFEFTLFKVGPLLHWAHVAVTDQKGQRFSYSREWVPPHQAGDDRTKLAVDYAGQALSRLGDGAYQLYGNAGDRKLALTFQSKKAPLLIGGDGKIDMPEGKDSWYYSLTRLETRGTLDGQPVKGLAWMDHQWGPFYVSGFADRWDWFSLQFEDNTEYNLFGFRSANGTGGARHVNVSNPDGSGQHTHTFAMDRLAWWQSPRTKKYYTTQWTIDLPDQHEKAELKATNVDQELWRTVSFLRDPLPEYWEGAMDATKIAANGKRIKGVGYCEHFGFGSPSGPR
jgi:predicted secreted hydrolase